MDHLKYFLDNVCEGDVYKYEQVENLAEVYYNNDIVPVALVEYKSTIGFIVRFRIGISSREVASLSRDMTEVDTSLIFDEDFIIDSQYGYLYGEDATKAFIQNIQRNLEESQMADALEGATYISNEPIIAAGSEFRGKTKIEKYWGDEL